MTIEVGTKLFCTLTMNRFDPLHWHSIEVTRVTKNFCFFEHDIIRSVKRLPIAQLEGPGFYKHEALVFWAATPEDIEKHGQVVDKALLVDRLIRLIKSDWGSLSTESLRGIIKIVEADKALLVDRLIRLIKSDWGSLSTESLKGIIKIVEAEQCK